jgi:hypothetical protein
MATQMRSGTKDHWSLRLRIKRPGTAGRAVLLILAGVQALLLFLTSSSAATSGALYGCSAPCGLNQQPDTPFSAIAISAAIFLLPAVIGALAGGWQEAIGLAVLPWVLVVILASKTLLAPAAGVAAGARGQPAVSQFGSPFWLDGGRLMPLLLALGLFALLGWIGWLAHEALFEA